MDPNVMEAKVVISAAATTAPWARARVRAQEMRKSHADACGAAAETGRLLFFATCHYCSYTHPFPLPHPFSSAQLPPLTTPPPSCVRSQAPGVAGHGAGAQGHGGPGHERG